VTDGLGVVSFCDANGMRPVGRNDAAWDNHLVAI
jgi:hypothetical protein